MTTSGFDLLQEHLSEDIGFRLFTVLLVDLPEVVRLHSSQPKAYSVTGRKTMGPTPWGAHVITGGKPWLGVSPRDLEWAFPDHALIASLGCGSCINVPVMDRGQTIGTLNLLDVEGRYGDDHLQRAMAYAAPAVPLLLSAQRETPT